MKNIKLIIAVIAVVVLAGGAYYVYSDIQEQELLQQQRDAQARAKQQADEQRQKEEAALAARIKCSDMEKFFVVTFDHENAVGQDILVKKKEEGDVPACKYEVGQNDFEVKNADPEYYKAIGASALVTDLGTGPSGRSFRLYDLGDKKMITEKKYFGELSVASTTLTYSGLAKQKADAKNCKEFKKITGDGMTPNLVVEKTIDLKTYSVKEGKTTTCVASQ